jgi:hypothetical protein
MRHKKNFAFNPNAKVDAFLRFIRKEKDQCSHTLRISTD